MGSGGIDNSQRQLQETSRLQADTAARAQAMSEDQYAKSQEYLNPLVGHLQSLIHGDPLATNQAIAPGLTNISRAAAQGKEAIYDQIPAGAARDYALSQLPLQTAGQVAQLQNQTYLSAFPTLASLSGQSANLSLGLLGAGVTSQGNSAITTGTVLQSQEQQKANAMGAFNALAGAAGTALGGPLGGALFGGGKH
jgi:hypothetical protein